MNMPRSCCLTLCCLIGLIGVGLAQPTPAAANSLARHYYSSWTYYPSRTYYYSYYYYKPTPSYNSYQYHYCVYYTAQPRYVYYYNPVSQYYWGRYDLDEKGYSLLAEKDRKKDLKDIPEKAFPKPGEMPAIPGSEDGERMLPIDPASLPSTKSPDDAPGAK